MNKGAATLLRSTCFFFALFALSLHPPQLQGQGFPSEDEGWSFPTNLNAWIFSDTDEWRSELNYPPISFTNLASSIMGNPDGTHALVVDSPEPAWLRYKVQEDDGTTNLTVESGSILLWFAPDWASATTNENGTGPGDWARLIEVGAYTTNASLGWWSLLLDPGGTNIYFMTQTNSGDGVTVTHLSAPIDWATNVWHNIALLYSPTNTALYLDGQLATNGAGLAVFPGPDVLTNGFCIGSDFAGLAQARGLFDDIYTYDFPLDAESVGMIYYHLSGYYSINIFNTQEIIPSAPPSPSVPFVFNAISGLGFLQWVSNATGCVTSTNVWMTNTTSVLTGTGTNITANCTFAIAGGESAVGYDVFATAVLTPADSAFGWAWLGQGFTCNFYTMTNLPPPSSFLRLGTPLDSDMDGLTDAYENLVSKTDPFTPDTDGDGLSDYYEIIAGLSPLTANALPSLGSISIPTCPVP